MAWVILVVAGLFEVAWSFGMKKSDGFTKLGPSVFTLVTLACSMFLLGWAMKTLPLGTAYTIWTGIGAIGAVVLGIIMLGESASPLRIACIVLILIGIVGLKLTTPAEKELPKARGVVNAN
jgi:quaternary ammonium compound-resistance protein SugE